MPKTTVKASLSEARFTQPRPDCPHPEYWHSDDPDSTEHEVTGLVAAMVRAIQPERVVETGAAFGQTSAAIGRALRTNKHGHLTTLEPDTVRAAKARTRCKQLPVTVLETPSLDYSPDGPVDMLWLDSLIHLRAQEVRHFAPHLTKRAVIGIHDTGPHHGVRATIDALLRDKLIATPLYLPTPRGVAFVRLAAGV